MLRNLLEDRFGLVIAKNGFNLRPICATGTNSSRNSNGRVRTLKATGMSMAQLADTISHLMRGRSEVESGRPERDERPRRAALGRADAYGELGGTARLPAQQQIVSGGGGVHGGRRTAAEAVDGGADSLIQLPPFPGQQRDAAREHAQADGVGKLHGLTLPWPEPEKK